jgi:hypothetical protein
MTFFFSKNFSILAQTVYKWRFFWGHPDAPRAF